MVILTSFKIAPQFAMAKASVARWMPTGEHYRVLDFLGAEGVGAVPLHLEDFKDPIKEFAAAYAAGLRERWEYVKGWLDELDPAIDLALLCWCPNSKNAQEWFAENGTLACHNLLIGKLIQRHRPDIEVVMDADRLQYGQPEWRPND